MAFERLDTTDFEAFYHEYMPRVYNFFRYRFGNNALAEDLTALTFEKAWHKRRHYRHDIAAFSTWLFTIARRVALDHYRRSRVELPLDETYLVDSAEDMEEQMQHLDDKQRLKNLLSHLPQRERELIALKYGAGLTNRMIAQINGLTESNVGVILHRTVNQLRREWEEPHE